MPGRGNIFHNKIIYRFLIYHSALLRSFYDAHEHRIVKLLVNLTCDIIL